MIKMNMKIGSTPIQIEAENLKELFQQTELLTQLPTACRCGHTDIRPAFASVKGNDFYSLKCAKCESEFKLGQRKEDGGLFPRYDEGWKDPFRKNNSSSEPEDDAGEKW
jgi:hypothetical protein